MEQKPDVFEKQGEESKKGKIAKYALLASMGISITAGVIAAFRHKGGVVKAIKENFSKVKMFLLTAQKDKRSHKK